MQGLHLACYNADLELVRSLLHSAENPNAVDKDGCTPLYWSCFRGAVGEQVVVVSALFDAGGDPNIVLHGPVDTPLTAAIESGNRDLVSLLLKRGASPNMLTSQGVSPLMASARCGDVSAVRILLESGASRDVVCDGYSATDYANQYGNPEIAREIDSWQERSR